VSEIEKIDIGEGITSTGKYFCANCTKLKDVKLPETLKDLSLDTFWDTSLKEITVPESVVTISDEAFLDSSNLEKVYCSAAQATKCAVAIEGSRAGIEPIIYEKYGDAYYIDGKFYQNAYDMTKNNNIKKRIYTVDEARKDSGETNRVTIRYK
ncbi:MAG: leucine-rich repeat domain-containing protein, partial [Alphaproteobacteria bacterium]|nr:leucine-rich repeat domain-containing protein [Alphaproteobacteria bacterium]